MMDRAHFVRESYQRTGGWLPVNPLGQRVKLGDFCQIQQAALKPLGNIFDLQLISDNSLNSFGLNVIEFPLDEARWKLSSGVHQTYCASEQVAQDGQVVLTKTKQELSFSNRGSFVFHGSNPICHLLTNWSEFEKNITIQLTQRAFAFRHLYVITELIEVENWALAIARENNASLQMSSELSETDFYRLFSHLSCAVEQSNGMHTYIRSNDEPARFFKAKKLVLKQKKKDFFLNQMLQSNGNLSDQEFATWLDTDLLNLVESNELNIATAMDFFSWVDTTLDEAELLC